MVTQINLNSIRFSGTEWKGRVQLAVSMTLNTEPVVNMLPIKDSKQLSRAQSYQEVTYELRAELHYAMNLHKNDEEYYIKVRWGNTEVSTKKKKADKNKNRLVEFYESLKFIAKFPYGVDEVGQII